MTLQIDFAPAGMEHLPEFLELAASAGWPHRAEDIAPTLSLGRPWRAINRKSGKIIGVAVWWPMGPGFGRVGLVIVEPKFQGLGIGRDLMLKVLEDATTRTLMLLATEEGRPLYEKLGFKSTGLTQRHQGEVSGLPDWQNKATPAGPDDFPEIIALDKRVNGADRTPMISHLLQVGETVLIKSGGKITGYAISRVFGKGSVVGPVVARSEDDAIALFSGSVPAGIVRVDRPCEANNLGHHLETCGIKGQEITHSMVLGNLPAKNSHSRIYALSSHAWG